MTVNDLPSWVPLFNAVASITALVLALPGITVRGWNTAYRLAFTVALVILTSGALFQANILPLWAWIIFGTGGRLVILALVVAGTIIAWPSRPTTTLADIAAQIHDIRRMTESASQSAEAAAVAASAADDRVLSQAERTVDDRERAARIEDAITVNTYLTQLAADHADAAYKEANSVNEKIAAQGAVIVSQGEQAADDRLIGADTNETAHRIDERMP